MTHDRDEKETLARHAELHADFDELLACFLLAHKDKRPSSTTALELMVWSHETTRDASACGGATADRPLDATRNQATLEGRCYLCGAPFASRLKVWATKLRSFQTRLDIGGAERENVAVVAGAILDLAEDLEREAGR